MDKRTEDAMNLNYWIDKLEKCKAQRDAALLQYEKLRAEWNDLISERERLRIKVNDLVDKRDALLLQVEEQQKKHDRLFIDVLAWFGLWRDKIPAEAAKSFHAAVDGPTPLKPSCEHDWKDARNEIIKSGEVCLKCFAIRAGNATTDLKRNHVPEA